MFSISEPGNGKSYCLRETSFLSGDNLFDNIQRIVFELSFLAHEFQRTNVIIVSPDYDFIPASYFDSHHQQELYDFTRTSPSGRLLSGLLEKQDIIVLYDIQKELYDFLLRNLWNPHFVHHTQLAVNIFEDKGRFVSATSRLYVNMHGNFMDLISFSGDKIKHCITYKEESVMNQLYYILKMWEKEEFDQFKDYIYIAGKPDETLVSKLQSYIKNIELVNAPSEIYMWSEDASKAPLDLLSLSL